jgi:hypothetical protein
MEKITMQFGKYTGEDVENILKEDPQYLRFIYYKAGCGRQLKDWIKSHWNEIEERTIFNPKTKKYENK